MIPSAWSPGSCRAGWREAGLGDPCDPLWFGGEKELGWGVQGSGFECWLRYYLSALSLPFTRPQLSPVGNGRCGPRPSSYRCGGPTGVVVQARKRFGSRSQQAEPLALIVTEG